MRDTADDDIALKRNHEELTKELHRDKPRKEIVLALARNTFQGRRTSILSETDDISIASLLTDYHELRTPYVVINA